jgi:hypothetical protein
MKNPVLSQPVLKIKLSVCGIASRFLDLPSIQGRLMATASIDGHARLYDLRKGCMNADNLNGKTHK